MRSWGSCEGAVWCWSRDISVATQEHIEKYIAKQANAAKNA